VCDDHNIRIQSVADPLHRHIMDLSRYWHWGIFLKSPNLKVSVILDCTCCISVGLYAFLPSGSFHTRLVT
jgi:hypothetical protein